MRRDVPKNVHKVTRRKPDGSVVVYYYAWRGGPPLEGEPGSAAFKASYRAAVRGRKTYGKDGALTGLVADYRASPEFAGLADSTRPQWAWTMNLIEDEASPLSIATMPTKVLGDPRAREHIYAWRDQWKDKPRKADYAMQVLSVILSWAANRGRIPVNILLGHKGLYRSSRADQVWTDDELRRFAEAAPSPEVGYIPRLAVQSGFRRSDLLRVAWSDVGDSAIILQPDKSRGRRRPKKVIVPLLDDTLALLAEIRAQQERRWRELVAAAERKGRPPPPRPTTILSNTRCRPWTTNGAEHQIVAAKRKAGIDKHLHDARGTFATRLRKDGATAAEIADILGWEEKRVERLLSVYVDTESVVMAFAERLRARSAARREG